MYSIGIDIGISSVGWSVLKSKTGWIDDLGVALFSAQTSEANADRRGFRTGRRSIRRKKNRKLDGQAFLHQHGFFVGDVSYSTPYHFRVKGLTEQLSKEELYSAVMHLLKKRGISYLEEEPEEKVEGVDFSALVQKNAALLKDHTPGEIQLQRLNQGQRVRTGLNQEGTYILNVFTVSSYAKELRRILEKQSEFYPEINEDFIHFFTDKEEGLIYRKRPYYHGPGNANNPSPYGRWSDYPLTGKPAENIFDRLIGKDLTGKRRASTLSYTAQIYNLLNDLNNLTLTSREETKLTYEEKQALIDYLTKEDVSRFGVKDFAKWLKVDLDTIKGFRIDAKEKPEMHSLKAFRSWKQIFAEYDLDISMYSVETLDQLAEIITLNTDKEGILKTIQAQGLELDDKLIGLMANDFKRLKSSSGQKAWHSFSLETMQILIPELLHTNEEQNTILERLGIKKELRNELANFQQIPLHYFDEDILNPTVRKSVRKSIEVLNTLVKRYGKDNIDYVTIEMPREDNEDERKKTIKKIQDNNKLRKEQSHKYFLEKSQWSPERFAYELKSPRFAQKLYYYFQQDGKCAYSGKPIQPEDLLKGATEIDHIIPLSISQDDSLHNKVLVLASANQLKGQRSPLMAFNEDLNILGQTKEAFVGWVMTNKQFSKQKKRLLLDERDIFDPSVQEGFVKRNLVDTRYASRTVLNAVQSFFNQNQTKVKVVNGSLTHTLRKKWESNLEKTRETHYHHAVDATLCAVVPFVKVSPYEYYYSEASHEAMMRDLTSGELIPLKDFKKLPKSMKRNYELPFEDFIGQLTPLTLYPRIHFSHQVDRKVNRKVSDATIYSTRELTVTDKKGKESNQTMVLGTIKDIYTVKGYEDFVKHRDQLLMKELDPQTYQILLDIEAKYDPFEDKQDASGNTKRVPVSPFKRYCEANGLAGIQKFSHKGNGPLIRKLKYYDAQLGNHINVTKDLEGNKIESTKHGKKVVLLSQNPWRTDVYYHKEENKFYLVGIKYCHLKFQKDSYGVPKKVYDSLLEKEQVPQGAEFRFSLYTKDRVLIETADKKIEGLYHSRTTNNPNYFELKPLDKTRWNSKEELDIFGFVSPGGQFVKGLKATMSITKIITDILGKPVLVHKEALKGILED